MNPTQILILSTILAGAHAAGYAQPGRMDAGERGPGRARGRIHDELKLTEKQEEQMDRLRLELQKKMDVQRARVREARVELRAIHRAGEVDRAGAEKHLKTIADAELQMRLARLDHRIAVDGMLTKEQREIWKDRMERRPGGPGFGRPPRHMKGHRHADGCCAP